MKASAAVSVLGRIAERSRGETEKGTQLCERTSERKGARRSLDSGAQRAPAEGGRPSSDGLHGISRCGLVDRTPIGERRGHRQLFVSRHGQFVRFVAWGA